MPALLTTTLLVVAALLCFTVTPWAGIPITAIALVNELARMAVMAAVSPDDE